MLSPLYGKYTAQPVAAHFKANVRVNPVTTKSTRQPSWFHEESGHGHEAGVMVLKTQPSLAPAYRVLLSSSGLRYGSETSQCHCNRDRPSSFSFLRPRYHPKYAMNISNEITRLNPFTGDSAQ